MALELTLGNFNIMPAQAEGDFSSWVQHMTKQTTHEPKAGDRVEWDSSGGHSVGKVVEKVTSPTRIKSHQVAASPENPEFIVKSARTGKLAPINLAP